MKKSYHTLQLFSCFLFLSTMTLAQTGVRDTAFINQATAFAEKVYTQKTRQQSPLYNGSQHAVYNPVEEEHPYFMSYDWLDGSIEYSGEPFDSVSLMYDLATDKVITEHFSGAYVELIPTKVSAFTINGHRFRRFKNSNDTRRSITEGFYEVLYDGKTKILKRHTKTFVQNIKSTEIINSFDEKTRYFVVKDNAFYPIRSRSGLTRILSDKKQELRRIGRSARSNDEVFVQLAVHYDTLTQ
jgi:hypothetical protein